MKHVLSTLVVLLFLVGCGKNDCNESPSSAHKRVLTQNDIADSLMREANKRCALLDAQWDTLSFSEAYLKVRHESNTVGFFYHNGAPYCTFSKLEWNRMSRTERSIAVKIAKQRYDARRLVKAFFMRYGYITSYTESFFTRNDGVYVSYRLSALQNDTKQTLFNLDTFVIDLQRPKFKYYSTMRERNPDPRHYGGLMERGANSEYYGKWIDCSDKFFYDISALVIELQKTLNPELISMGKSIFME